MLMLEQLLLNALSESPTRAFRSIDRGAIFFGTDVGLRREENQDRVAVAKWRSNAQDDARITTAVVVSDGMGGLQDGAFCAAKSVSTFIAKLIQGGSRTRQNVEDAVRAANDEVFTAYRGKGGATLSAAIFCDDGTALGVNVGDSRIYSPIRAHTELSVRRLTVDDTMKEAFGSEGDGLLQFIGVGQGLQPHIIDLQNSDLLAITTDGAHFVEQHIFSQILARSPDPKALVERTVALSRWLGAPDNTTVAAMDVQRLTSEQALAGFATAEIWTGGRDGPLYVIDYSNNANSKPETGSGQSVAAPASSSSVERSPSPSKQAPKGKRRRKATPNQGGGEQLTIDVEVTEGSTSDADS